MNSYYTLFSGDNYDDESIGDERSEEGKQHQHLQSLKRLLVKNTPRLDAEA